MFDPTATTTPRPEPSRASDQFPSTAALGALGIDLQPWQARIVLAVLSRYLARGRAQTRSHFRAMMTALTYCCTIELAYDGEVEPAPHPALAEVVWPHAQSVFRRLGVNAAALAEYWVRARNRFADPCYPVEWTLAFSPAQLWPAVWTLIEWGPERTRIRLEEAAVSWPKRPRVSRGAGASRASRSRSGRSTLG